MKNIKAFVLCAALALICANRGQATLLYGDAGGGNDRTGDGFSLGSQFTVSADNILVTDIGFWDDSGNALGDSHEVALWDVTAGNIQVADVTILAGTSNGGTPGFVFVSLPTVLALINGDTYTLAAYYSSSSTDDLRNCCEGGAPTTDPEFTSVVGAYTASNLVGALSEPNGLAGHPYVGPNLQFEIAPEPGTLSTLLCGAGVLCWIWRRRPQG